MAITHDADTSSGVLTDATTATFSHTVANHADRLLVMCQHTSDDVEGTDPLVFTFNGDSFTKIGHNKAASPANVRLKTGLYYLLAPDVGTHDIVLTMSQECQHLEVSVSGWYEVDQAAPVASAGNVDTASVSTAITPTGIGQLIVDTFISDYSPDLSCNQTQIFQVGLTTALFLDRGGMSYKISTSTAETVMGWGGSAAYGSYAAVFGDASPSQVGQIATVSWNDVAQLAGVAKADISQVIGVPAT